MSTVPSSKLYIFGERPLSAISLYWDELYQRHQDRPPFPLPIAPFCFRSCFFFIYILYPRLNRLHHRHHQPRLYCSGELYSQKGYRKCSKKEVWPRSSDDPPSAADYVVPENPAKEREQDPSSLLTRLSDNIVATWHCSPCTKLMLSSISDASNLEAFL